MSITVTVRRAEPDDADGIVSLHRDTWSHDAIDEDTVRRLLMKKTHVAFVAVEASKVIGYADGFATFDAQGTRRWELDLLAVQPDIRGCGVGSALIEAQKTHAGTAEVQLIRALVRAGNVEGQRAFGHAGFEIDPIVYRLYTSSLPDNMLSDVPASTHLIPIETFTYRGFWIEGRIRPATLADIQSASAPGGHSHVGMLLPEYHRYQSLLDQIPGFSDDGAYQWWSHLLTAQR
ncbi:MAG: GNAT family N-acetyltransferase [Candidatus Latescibacteria bacterium]|nr:GNAT family N-acetyltransferase [Candidatus Latescibacterota bacterium]